MSRFNWKTFAPITLAFGLVALFVAWYFPSRQHDVLAEALQSKASAMAELLAYSVAPAVEFQDSESIREALRGVNRDSDVRYVAVVSAGGEVVERHFLGGTEEATVVTHAFDGPLMQDGLLHVSIRVPGAVATRARLVAGFSTSALERESASNTSIALGIALLIVLSGLFVAAFISKMMNRVEGLLSGNRRALEAAKAASEAKSQFLANTSHEIRTPLNGVLGLAHLLTRASTTPDQRQLSESIERSGQQLLDIVNDILDFSKIEAGRLELVEDDFDLVHCVEDVAATFSQTASEQNLEVVCHLSPELPRSVRGDSLRLRQILTNLVGNAVKFTREGQVVVRVHETGRQDERVQLQFDVEDSGIGMSAEQQVSVFSAFSQGDATTTRKFGGTGLGLAICKQLSTMMRGELSVSSEEGRGSTFTLRVPMALASGEEPVMPDLRGLRVLLVDDHSVSRQVLTAYATQHGATCEEADDGNRGLSRLREAADEGKPYDVLLLDLRLPGLDGMEVARRVRADDTLRDVGIVMVSAFSHSDSETLALGASFLTKPVRLQALLEAVQAAASGHVVSSIAPPGHISPLTSPISGAPAGPRVLVAEDNETNRFVIEGMLETLGYRPTCVLDGQQAVDAFTADPGFGIMLMDCQMPVMDGYTASSQIRDWEHDTGAPRRPIVAVTAHAFQEDRKRAEDAGMDDYVTKPVDIKALRDTLLKWCPRVSLSPAEVPAVVQGQAPSPAAESESVSESGGASPAPQPLERDVLDDETIRHLKKLQSPKRPRFLATAVEKYVEGSLQALDQLRQAAENANGEQLRQAAHSLKGSSRMVGAVRAASVAEQIEELSQQQAEAVTEAHLDRLTREVKAAHNALEQVAAAC